MSGFLADLMVLVDEEVMGWLDHESGEFSLVFLDLLFMGWKGRDMFCAG